jgi:hypothetical protein
VHKIRAGIDTGAARRYSEQVISPQEGGGKGALVWIGLALMDPTLEFGDLWTNGF